MGRLPATWAQRVIMDRVPYEFSGEIFMTTGQLGLQFPSATFLNTVDKPFEVHRMIPRVYACDVGNVLVEPQPDQDLMTALVRGMITDLGLDQVITKNPTLLSLLTKGSSERTWEWADPHYLTRSNQFQVVLDALAFPASFVAAEITKIKVCMAFEGFLLVVAPPSENR